FCSFIAFWARKSAFALLLVFIWWIAEGILMLGEIYLRKEVINQSVGESSFLFTKYLPLNSASNLLDFSNVEFSGFVSGGTIFTYSAIGWEFVVVTLLYIVLFIFLSFRLLKKRDL